MDMKKLAKRYGPALFVGFVLGMLVFQFTGA